MDGLFFIQRGYLDANHFVYRSEEPALIDTGCIAGFEKTEGHLRALGVSPDRVRLFQPGGLQPDLLLHCLYCQNFSFKSRAAAAENSYPLSQFT